MVAQVDQAGDGKTEASSHNEENWSHTTNDASHGTVDDMDAGDNWTEVVVVDRYAARSRSIE